MKIKRYFGFMLFLLTLLFFTSCNNATRIELNDMPITHETKFGGVYILITIEDFNDKGFEYGDGVNISFSNGYKLENLPYYNGYYTNTGEPLLVGYSGYPYIKVGINNGDDLYNLAGLKEEDTANVELSEKGKYKDIQEALDIHYTDVQGDLPDWKFGNFRVVNVGKMKENILYRSASPVDNQHNRAKVCDGLISSVNTVLNLSDDNQELKGHIEKEGFNSLNYKRIYDNNRVIALSMNMNFQSGQEDKTPKLYSEFKESTFQTKLLVGLRFAIENDGPYLIHCVEGKDRTGFVCMVFEALSGATYNEIINDYMITYDNYYDINKETNLVKYNIIKEKNIDIMLKTIINDDSVDIKTANYEYYIEKYLISRGMQESEITTLKTKLCK